MDIENAGYFVRREPSSHASKEDGLMSLVEMLKILDLFDLTSLSTGICYGQEKLRP